MSRALKMMVGKGSYNPLTAISWAHAGWADDPDWTSGKDLDGLSLSGVTNAYASTPDSAALDITGDITLVAHLVMSDWTPAAVSCVVGKWNTTGNQRSYAIQVTTTGVLRFNYSLLGSEGGLFIESTVATGFTDTTANWVAVTVDVDNGAGGWDAKFYTSADGMTWSQLGTTVTTATPITFFNSTSVLTVGGLNAGAANLLTGTVMRAQVYSGIRDLNAATGGTLVFDQGQYSNQ